MIQSVACPSSPGQPSPGANPGSLRSSLQRETEAQPEHLSPNSHRPGASESGLGQEREPGTWKCGGPELPDDCQTSEHAKPGATPAMGQPRLEGASGGGGIWARGRGPEDVLDRSSHGEDHWGLCLEHRGQTPSCHPGGTRPGEGCLSRCRPPRARPGLTATLACSCRLCPSPRPPAAVPPFLLTPRLSYTFGKPVRGSGEPAQTW